MTELIPTVHIAEGPNQHILSVPDFSFSSAAMDNFSQAPTDLSLTSTHLYTAVLLLSAPRGDFQTRKVLENE